MNLNYRQLLKDVIPGTIWDHDIPASPASLNAAGKPIATKREALREFWSMVDDTITEQGGAASSKQRS
jgi:hypothetical protein